MGIALAFLVGFVVWPISMFRKNGFLKSSARACVASVVAFAIELALLMGYFAVFGLPS